MFNATAALNGEKMTVSEAGLRWAKRSNPNALLAAATSAGVEATPAGGGALGGADAQSSESSGDAASAASAAARSATCPPDRHRRVRAGHPTLTVRR
jgi:hypothetical protein